MLTKTAPKVALAAREAEFPQLLHFGVVANHRAHTAQLSEAVGDLPCLTIHCAVIGVPGLEKGKVCPAQMLNEREEVKAAQSHCQRVALSHTFPAEDDKRLAARHTHIQPDLVPLSIESKLSHIGQAVPHIQQHEKTTQHVEPILSINQEQQIRVDGGLGRRVDVHPRAATRILILICLLSEGRLRRLTSFVRSLIRQILSQLSALTNLVRRDVVGDLQVTKLHCPFLFCVVQHSRDDALDACLQASVQL